VLEIGCWRVPTHGDIDGLDRPARPNHLGLLVPSSSTTSSFSTSNPTNSSSAGCHASKNVEGVNLHGLFLSQHPRLELLLSKSLGHPRLAPSVRMYINQNSR
jgi:hypothetical protein